MFSYTNGWSHTIDGQINKIFTMIHSLNGVTHSHSLLTNPGSGQWTLQWAAKNDGNKYYTVVWEIVKIQNHDQKSVATRWDRTTWTPTIAQTVTNHWSRKIPIHVFANRGVRSIWEKSENWPSIPILRHLTYSDWVWQKWNTLSLVHVLHLYMISARRFLNSLTIIFLFSLTIIFCVILCMETKNAYPRTYTSYWLIWRRRKIVCLSTACRCVPLDRDRWFQV